MHITDEQKQTANQVDLVSYLESRGYEMVKRGSSYKLKITKPFPGDMSSVSIFENRRGWKRWSTGEHGGDAISFLEKNFGMTFQEAVCELTGSPVAATYTPVQDTKTEHNEEKTLELPKKCDGKFSRLFAYLNQTRMIDKNIILQMINEKKIYQDTRNNVVFVGYDENNTPKFGCVRGTNTNAAPYRGDCDGSDKRYSFSMEGKNTKGKLYVFEAPIDLMSHATMANIITKNPEAWKQHSRICLAGTSDVALEHYLKSHPEIKEIHFCLDSDEAGLSAAAKHCEKYSSLGYVTKAHQLKYKDMNEELIALVGKKPPPVSNRTGQMRR